MGREWPPRIPPELAELDRAVMLLGSRAKGMDLSAPRRKELATLIGAYPDAVTAARWKAALRPLRAEVAAEADPEPGASSDGSPTSAARIQAGSSPTVDVGPPKQSLQEAIFGEPPLGTAQEAAKRRDRCSRIP